MRLLESMSSVPLRLAEPVAWIKKSNLYDLVQFRVLRILGG